MKKRSFSFKQVKERYNSLPEITAQVFLVSAVSFFLSSLMSTMGGIVDGFIIGHTMETADVGALSLTSPVWFLSAVIYGILTAGAQPRCTVELTQGNQEKARQIFSMTLITGTVIALAMAALILTSAGFAAQLLGARPGSAEYIPCMAYLRGIAIGLPALVAGNIISMSMNLEGARRWAFRYAMVLTASNILLDLLVVVTHGTLLMMGITTSISYYAALAVYIVYYLRNRDSLLKPELCRVSLPLIGSMALFGLPMGVRKITALFRSVYLNHLLAASATSYGVAAYNVQVQVGYLTNDLFMAIALTMAMILGFYYSEENKNGLRYTVSIALGLELVFGLAITFLLRDWDIIPKVSWFYLGNNPESITVANVAVYFFAVGLLGQALSSLFAVYLQTIGRTFLSNAVYILSDVVLVVASVQYRLRGLSPAVSDAVRSGVIFDGVSEAQLMMLAVIPVIILLVNFSRKRRPETLGDMILMLPKGYGNQRGFELAASPRTIEQVMDFSEKAYDFCLGHGAGKREAYYISLAAEEMAGNIIKHGFFRDGGHHTMELRVIHKKNSFMLRIRDNSHIFDPIKKMAAVSSINDPSRYIGIKMVMKMATDVVYTSTLKLNNLVIRIDMPEEKQVHDPDDEDD